MNELTNLDLHVSAQLGATVMRNIMAKFSSPTVDNFCTKTYLETYYLKLDESNKHLYFLEKLDYFWSHVVQDRFANSGSMLDYGAGPVISRYITAVKHIQTIVAAEYLETNRKALKDWIAGELTLFDWKSSFEYVVQKVEGRSSDEVNKRQIEVKRKIKAVVPCDSKATIRLQLPSDISDAYRPPYDIVMTSLIVETVVDSEEEYKDHVAYLARLVRPGGYLVMLGSLEETFYTVGSERFQSFPITKELVVKSVGAAGLNEIVFDLMPLETEGRDISDTKAFFFMYARA